MSDIYQEIWDADQDGNGIAPVLEEDDGDPSQGFVLVNETVNEDPDHRLFPKVVIPEAKEQTYAFCRRLFNNYTLDQTKREIKTPEEDEEVFDLLDAMVETPPMRVARQFVEAQTGETYTDSRWNKVLTDIWFRQFDMGSGTDLSAFEHIVVGEQKQGKAQGYHFWYKYFLDDSEDFLDRDDIVFIGPRYGPLSAEGFLTPEVATFSYRWDAFDYDAGERRPLFKPIGGFWNGCSIEGLLALGTVRFIPTARAPKEGVINGGKYELKIYRSNDGRSMRTFYPKFLGRGIPVAPVAETRVRIVAALVNPEGDDPGRESVTLLNTAPEAVDLAGWALRAPNGDRFTLEAVSLEPGATERIVLPAHVAPLSNKGGPIALLDGDGEVAHEVRYTKSDARRQGWTLVF